MPRDVASRLFHALGKVKRMPMTHSEMTDLLSALAGLDSLHTIQSQEKLAKKADAWLLVLDDVEYGPALHALKIHYQDPNAKSLTPAILRMKTLLSTPRRTAANQLPPDSQAAIEARERACTVVGCPCPHEVCRAGFLDEETQIVTRHGAYPAVKRCPTCQAALEARSGLA